MFPITNSAWLAPNIKQFEVVAPRIARKQRAGQFVIIRLHEQGERIPLTIAGANPAAGTISLIVQGVGKTTKLMNSLETGDAILDVVGPLGVPSDTRKFGNVIVVAGGVGAAIAYPTARGLSLAGNQVTSILGARTRELVLLEQAFAEVSVELLITTDDGSYGERALVTDKLRELIGSRKVDAVFAMGPIAMMRAVAEVTRPPAIHTVVSLNSIMVDGTGMCGGCRVLVGSESKFACVDGPEFDAHLVDFEVLAQRNRMYTAAETRALAAFEADPAKDLSRARESCRLAEKHPEVALLLGVRK